MVRAAVPIILTIGWTPKESAIDSKPKAYRVDIQPNKMQKPNVRPLISVGNNSLAYVNIKAKFAHKTSLIKLDMIVCSHYRICSENILLLKSSNKRRRHNIVVTKEHPKLKYFLYSLCPKGITRKFPINSENPRKIPFTYIFDNPSH